MSTLAVETAFERFRTHGDIAALTGLFDEVAPELLPLALRLSGARHDAEDLVQETFLVALEKQADYDSSRPLRPWLIGILVREARRLRRKSSRVLEPERLHAPAPHEPLDEAAQSELRCAVEEALGELPPRYSSVVSLHLFEGLAPRELSARLGIDAELVRTQLARGLEKLRRSLPASGATAWSVSELGLVVAAIRARVLARARSVPLAASAGGAGVLALAIALSASLCTVAALTAGGLSLVHGSGAGSQKLDGVALEASAMPHEPATGGAPLENGSSAPREPALASPQALPASARLHGRLLLPDGSAARGVTVTLEGKPSNEDLVRMYGVPKDWKDPAAVQTDAQGEFQFRLEPPRAFQWFVRARSQGFVDLGWRFNGWADGDKELGAQTFEPACALSGRLVRADGSPIGPGWSILADPGQDGRQPEVLGVLGSGRVDPASGRFRIDGLPAGSTHVEASHDVGLRGCDSEVVLAPAGAAALELTWAGADPAHTVCVRLTDAWHIGVDPQDLRAQLVDRDGRKLQPVEGPAYVQAIFFEQVPESEWRLEVEGPRFGPLRREAVRPGQVVRAQLEGDAGIRLHVSDQQGKAIEHYDARLTLMAGQSARVRQLASLEELSADGRSFEKVPSTLPFQLEIRAAGFGSARVDGAALSPGESRAVRVALVPTHELVIRTLDSDGKRPLAGVAVELTRGSVPGHSLGARRLYGRGGEIPARDFLASTDADGRARFQDLAQDTWTARARWSGWLFTDTRVDLREPNTGERALVLPEHGFLRGKVLLAKEARLEDAALFVAAEHAPTPGLSFGAPFPTTAVATDGSFRLGPLAPGRLVIFLMRCAEEEAGESRKPVEIARVQIEPGKETVADIDLRRQCTAHLELKVLLGGKPMSNPYATVLLMDPPEAGVSDSARGKADGSVRIALAPEQRQRITLRESGWVWCLPEIFTPAECETLARTIEVPLVKGSLRILDEQTHEPLRSALVSWSTDVREPSEDPALPGMVVMSVRASGTTDTEGRLELTLPPVELRFVAGDDKGLFSAWPPKPKPSGQSDDPGVRLRWTDKGPAEATIALPRR